MTSEKTYKREAAVSLVVFVLGMFTYGVHSGDTVAVDVAKFLTTPVMLFAAAAFGLDAYSKQVLGR